MENSSNTNVNTKKALCKFFIGLFCITAFTCLVIFSRSREDYIHEKADVAWDKINALQSGIRNPNVNTSELDKIVQKRNACIGGMIISIIAVIVCSIILYCENKNTPQPKDNSVNPIPKTDPVEQVEKSEPVKQIEKTDPVEQVEKTEPVEPNNFIINNSETQKSMQSKLKELKQLYEDELITKEEYDSKRKELLDNF